METLSQGLDIQLLGTYIFHFAGGPPDEGFEFADERNITISVPEQGAGFSLNLAGNGQGTYTALNLAGNGQGTYTALNGRLEIAGYADAGTVSVTGVPFQASMLSRIPEAEEFLSPAKTTILGFSSTEKQSPRHECRRHQLVPHTSRR